MLLLLFVASTGVLTVLVWRSSPARAVPIPPDIKASAAILVDAKTGHVLYERNADLRRPPASLTKVMTAILVLEHLPLDSVVEAHKEDSETDGSSLYLLPGERISAEDLVYAILLRSANDACMAAARAVAGTPDAFIEMMNRKAVELGATNTHFVNPNGLHAPGHYTTARDLARIACYAVRYAAFNEVVRTRYRIIRRDPKNKDVYLKNHAKLLWHYPGADGIKTGYTVPAGRCFLGSATRNGWRLISVVLNSPDMYGETRRLLDYGFGAFKPVVVTRAGTPVATAPVTGSLRGTVPAIAAADLRYVAPRSGADPPRVEVELRKLTPPVPRGTVVGEARAIVNGQVVATTRLCAAESAEPLPPPTGETRHGLRILGTIATIGIFTYVSAHPKGSRRRRRSIETGLRDIDAVGAGYGERPGGAGAGGEG